MARGTKVARDAALEAQGPGLVDVGLVEAFADHARESADGDGAEALVAGQRLRLVITPDLPPGVEGQLSPSGNLYVRRCDDPAHELLVALHELAHHLLAGTEHTHADVWRLALALGAPKPLVRRAKGDAVSLAAATGLPVWACELRLAAVRAGLG